MYVWHSSQRSQPGWFPMTIGLASIFFALLILILLSNSLTSMPGIAIKLPHIGMVKNITADKFVVTITKDNKIFYNGQIAADINDLKTRIAGSITYSHPSSASNRKAVKPMVVICADRSITIQEWLNLTAAIRELGLDVYLASEAPFPRGKKLSPYANVQSSK